MASYGILIDYQWCSGCRTCEIACQMENGLPVGHFGVVVNEIGPWQIDGDDWQHTFIPNFTDECTLCAKRTAVGKLPSCVQHCQADILSYGLTEELVKKMGSKTKQILVVPS